MVHPALANLTPLPTQRRFVEDDGPLVYLTGTAASGKTFAGALKCLDFMLANDGARGLAVAPDHEAARLVVVAHLRWMCQVCHLACAWDRYDARLTLDDTFSTVTVISAKALPTSGLRSVDFAFAWLDAAHRIDPQVEWMARARLRQSGIRPQLWATGRYPRSIHVERIEHLLTGAPFTEPHALGTIW